MVTAVLTSARPWVGLGAAAKVPPTQCQSLKPILGLHVKQKFASSAPDNELLNPRPCLVDPLSLSLWPSATCMAPWTPVFRLPVTVHIQILGSPIY